MNWKDRYDTPEYEYIFLHCPHMEGSNRVRIGNRFIMMAGNPTAMEHELRGFRLDLFTTNFDFQTKLPKIYYAEIMPTLVVKRGEYNYIEDRR